MALTNLLGGLSLEATQADVLAAINALLTELQAKADLADTQPVSVVGMATAANQSTVITRLTEIRDKLLAAPATEAKQDTGNTTLASILTELGAKLEPGDLNGLATEITLAAILAKIIAAPATEAKQDASITQVTSINTTIGAQADVAASSDTGSFSLLAFVKRGLQNWGSLLGFFRDEDTAHTSGDKGLPVFGIRSDTDAATANDGDYTLFKLDEEGRLKVASKPASYPDVTGDITAVQATIGTPVAGGTVIANVDRASNVMMFCTGTFSAVNCTFEASLESSGETWFGVLATRTNANTAETTTGSLSAAPAYAWELSVNGIARVRVRCTARTSGTQSWRIKLGTYATEPIPTIQTHAVTGSGTFTVAANASTNLIGDVGHQVRANSTGAATPAPINSPATPVGQNIKGSAGRVYGFQFTNNGAGVRYVKFFNATSVTMGTTAALFEVAIAVGQTISVAFAQGLAFGTGIQTAVTGGRGLTNNTAITLDDVTGFVVFS